MYTVIALLVSFWVTAPVIFLYKFWKYCREEKRQHELMEDKK